MSWFHDLRRVTFSGMAALSPGLKLQASSAAMREACVFEGGPVLTDNERGKEARSVRLFHLASLSSG